MIGTKGCSFWPFTFRRTDGRTRVRPSRAHRRAVEAALHPRSPARPTILQHIPSSAASLTSLTLPPSPCSATQYSVPLIINDRLDIALSLSCGLHIGQSDLPALEARRLLGPNQLLGVSINTLAELDEVLAYPEGTVDYIGIGPCYGTLTKKDLNPLMGTRGVRSILKRLGESKIRAVVIGTLSSFFLPSLSLALQGY